MKLKFQLIIVLALTSSVMSCKKDNYEAPTSQLTGRLVYKGEPINVQYDQVPFQIYQFGFGRVGPINGTFTPEGNFAALLFDGEYKLTIPSGQGPFMWRQTGSGKPDSIVVNMKGNQTLDIEVTPYYMIRTPQISASAGTVTATFKAEKIITDANGKDIEKVALYISKTKFASAADNVAVKELVGTDITNPNSITLSQAIPAIVPAQKYVFARVGIKMKGVEDWIFSPVQKVQF